MGTHANHPDTTHEDLVKRSRAALRIEMRATDCQLLAGFRNTFLQWVNSETGSDLLRDAGAPHTVAFEEVAGSGADPRKTLRMEVLWEPDNAPQLADGTAPVEQPHVVEPASLESGEDVQFVFFPDAQPSEPIYHVSPHALHAAAVDATIAEAQGLRASLAMSRRRVLPARLRRFNARSRAIYRARARALRNAGIFTQALAIWQRISDPVRLRVLLRTPRQRTSFLLASLSGIAVIATLAAYFSHRPLPQASDEIERADVAQSAPAPATEVPSPSYGSVPPVLVTAGQASALGFDIPLLPPVVAGRGVATSGTRSFKVPAADPPGPVASASKPVPSVSKAAASASKPAAPAPKPVDARAEKPVVTRVEKPSVEVRTAVTEQKSSPSELGTLVVNSEPQGAEVSINGVVHGRTPLKIQGLRPGSRVVRLELAGFERWSWAVNVVANRQTPLIVRLQPDNRRALSPAQ